MNKNSDQVFYAATKILAATVTGGKGEGLHKSPVLVRDAVELAEQLVAEIEKREAQETPAPTPAPTSGVPAGGVSASATSAPTA